METKFQTSFIPKKQLTASTGGSVHHSVSVFLTLSILVFIISLAGAGFALAWQSVLVGEQNQYKKDLANEQNEFNTDLITTLKTADMKISIAKSLLANHLAVSQIFSIISQITISSVQWKSMSFSADGSTGTSPPKSVTVTMQGVADSFYAVAYQSDVLAEASGLGSTAVIKNPVLSNLSVDAATGRVNFSFTATVDPSKLSYADSVAAAAGATTSVPISNQ